MKKQKNLMDYPKRKNLMDYAFTSLMSQTKKTKTCIT